MKHLRVVFTYLILLNINQISEASTSVSGNVFGHWTVSGSPYNVINSITVPSDSLLIIDPGVHISFLSNYKMKIDGNVIASGTIADSIVFSAPSSIPGFAGLRFETTNASQDSSIFEYCQIYNGNAGSNLVTGIANYGGGFFMQNFSKIRIQHCNISNCNAFDAGGAIACYTNSNPLILDNIFFNNHVTNASSTVGDGAAVYCRINSNPLISKNTFTNNSAAARGAAIYSNSCSPMILDNLIENNYGYPVFIAGNGNTTVIGNTIQNNNGFNQAEGAGLHITATGNVIVQNNNINHNNNYNYAGYQEGGGIYVGNAQSILIKGNLINYNSVSSTASTTILMGGGIYCNSTINAKIEDNFICNNALLSAGDGAGVYIKNGTLINNVICNNYCSGFPNNGRGGGVYTQDTVTIINNTIANNHAVKGGGVFITGHRKTKIRNSILFGNEVSSNGIGNQIYCYNGLTTDNFDIQFCNIDSGQVGIGLLNNNQLGQIYLNNIDTIPYFVNPSIGAGLSFDGTLADWSLQNNSSCINSGDSTVITSITDILGNDRIFDSNIDIGAYEFQSIIGPQVNAFFNVSNACVNSNINIINTSSNATSYNWLMPGASPSNDTQASPVISYGAPGTYQIQLIASNGTDSDTIIQSITIYPSPIVNAGPDMGICWGNSVTLNASASGTLTYNWEPSVNLTTPTQSQTIANPISTTEYVITVNDGFCSANDTVSIIVWPLPIPPTITQVGITLEATTGFAAYQWYENNVIIAGETQSTITPLNDGNYTVDAIDTNGCISTSQAFSFVIQGLNAITNNQLSIYPNPANNFLFIANAFTNTYNQIEIIDVLGKVILFQTENNSLIKLNIENLPSGLYLLRSGNQSLRFIKQN